MGTDLFSASQTIGVTNIHEEMRESGFGISSTDARAQAMFEDNITFKMELELVEDPKDGWLCLISKFVSDLAEFPPKLYSEIFTLAKEASKGLVEEACVDPFISFTKRRDFFLRRAELLDKDDELKASHLDSKMKIKKLF